jgi:hypothetical protein
MRNHRSAILMVCLVSAAFTLNPLWAGDAASPAPSVQELLDRYKQALDATQSCIDFYEGTCDYGYRTQQGSPAVYGKRAIRGQNRADGQRTFVQTYIWGDFNAQLRNLPASNPRYYLTINADRWVYGHNMAVNDPQVRGSASLQPSPTEKGSFCHEVYSGIFGFLGSDERLDVLLRGADRISVRPAPETIHGSPCAVIEADTKCGRYTVWLDPAHGYHAAKVVRKAVGGQHELGWDMAAGDQAAGSVEVIRFEQTGGVWVPMEVDQETSYTSGELFRKDHTRYKRTKITLNPDHDKLGSFGNPLLTNPANDPELKKNGTTVRVGGAITFKGSWQNGGVVDESGNVVDLRQMMAGAKVSLLNTTLPDLADLAKDLSQVQTSDKRLLVCLCDIEQRPSRQCLSTLAEKTGTLAAKGIALVVVQVSKVDFKQHEAWSKASGINLPIHMAEGDFETRKAAWAIKALPWLILTDKSHIVRAEGFAVGDLDKVLQEGQWGI